MLEGKTIKEVVVKETTRVDDPEKILLLFSDGTYAEIRGFLLGDAEHAQGILVLQCGKDKVSVIIDEEDPGDEEDDRE